MSINKHLTLEERKSIERMLHRQETFKAMGKALSRDCTTIRNEIKNHLKVSQKGSFNHNFNDCRKRFNCIKSGLCNNPDCLAKYCRFCDKCHIHCSFYDKEICPKLSKPPYVCNGCKTRRNCTLEKHLYEAHFAHVEYKECLSEVRSGICMSEKEAIKLDNFISPLLKKGQSIHHICVTHPDEIMCTERSIYNHVSNGMFSARRIDLPRAAKFRPRRKSRNKYFKVEKGCYINRTYEDYHQYLKEHRWCNTVQLDSVEGLKGGKVLLTIHFVNTEFMLAFLRDRNTAASVTDIFNDLYKKLSPSVFMKLFPCLLADRGSEFSNPSAIEKDEFGNIRTHMFFCDPNAPFQKGSAENNHEYIRRVLPKHTSFDNLTQEKVNLMMNHINSYARPSLAEMSPYEMFQMFYTQDVLKVLGAVLIPPQDITLHPSLLK